MFKKVGILATGSELTSGERVDTNSQFIASNLSKKEIIVNQHLTTDDNKINLKSGLKFLLDNNGIDTSTFKVYVYTFRDVSPQDIIDDDINALGIEYSLVENILNVDSFSEIYLIQEVQDEKYELLFGDGKIGKKLQNGDVITVQYITTDGINGNGIGGNNSFSFAGKISYNNPLTGSSGLTVFGQGVFYDNLTINYKSCVGDGTCSKTPTFRVNAITGAVDAGQYLKLTGKVKGIADETDKILHVDNLGSAGVGGTAGPKDFTIYQSGAIDSFGIDKYWTAVSYTHLTLPTKRIV